MSPLDSVPDSVWRRHQQIITLSNGGQQEDLVSITRLVTVPRPETGIEQSTQFGDSGKINLEQS